MIKKAGEGFLAAHNNVRTSDMRESKLGVLFWLEVSSYRVQALSEHNRHRRDAT